MLTAEEVARWFLIRNKAEQDEDEFIEPMTNLKLQKLLYYAQGVYLAITENALFAEPIVAWKHGPVVIKVYDLYKSNGANPIPIEPEEYDSEIIDAVEQNKDIADTLEFVFTEYAKKYSAWGLRNMTHEERPWKETPLNGIIDTGLIKDYFQSEVVEVN